MDIRYFEPFSRAFRRMKKGLFQPFDLKKWFVVGFTAFLAGLTDCNGGNGSAREKGPGNVDWGEILYFPQRAQEWLLEHPEWLVLIVIGGIVFILLIVVLTWLSSRGEFMFLDNVVHNRAQVKKPWYDFRKLGNSLFLWRIAVGLVVFLIIASYVLYWYLNALNLYEQGFELSEFLWPLIFVVLGFVVIALAAGFLELLVTDFIVPIMYRSGLSVLAAWRIFLPTLGSFFFHFFGYALFVLALWVLVVIGIIAAVLFTCCIALIFLVLPYINSVVLLPISYTLRAFSVEFLEQFGSDYAIFPRESSTP